MVHHFGAALVLGALAAVVFLPSSCNSMSSDKQRTAQAAAAPSVKTGTATVSGQLEEAARRQVLALCSQDARDVWQALSNQIGSAAVSEAQVSAIVARNRALSPTKGVVISREEVAPTTNGYTATVWFVLVRADETTAKGRIDGWRKAGEAWAFSPPTQ